MATEATQREPDAYDDLVKAVKKFVDEVAIGDSYAGTPSGYFERLVREAIPQFHAALAKAEKP